jgi:hypothetical protein
VFIPSSVSLDGIDEDEFSILLGGGDGEFGLVDGGDAVPTATRCPLTMITPWAGAR